MTDPRRRRFYCPQTLAVGAVVELPAQSARHATRVLRLRVGDALELFNGLGGEYRARLVTADRDRVCVAIDSHSPHERESPLSLSLLQGVARGERMDYCVQKATELGVVAIRPVFTERCMVKLSDERAARRVEHWLAVAASACEQCGRNRLPQINAPVTLAQAVAEADPESLRLVLDPEADGRLGELSTESITTCVALIGPEGGLTDNEVRAAVTRGFRGITLGPRTLRSETAGVALLAAAQTIWGDI